MNRFSNQLRQLQPPGLGLPTDPDSAWAQLLESIAPEFERIDGRITQLVAEITLSDRASELLDDWEQVFGLPDQCTGVPTEPAERLALIQSRLAAVGGQTRAYFIGLVAKLGFSAEIEPQQPFEVGYHGMGDPVGGSEWRHVWRLILARMPSEDIQRSIACAIDRYKPAHTVALIDVDNNGLAMWADEFHKIVNVDLPYATGSYA